MNTERESLLSQGWGSGLEVVDFIEAAAALGYHFEVEEVAESWAASTAEFMAWCEANEPQESDEYVVNSGPSDVGIVHAGAESFCDRVIFRGTYAECRAFLGADDSETVPF